MLLITRSPCRWAPVITYRRDGRKLPLLGRRTGQSLARFTRHDRARPNTVKKDFIIWPSLFLFRPSFVQFTPRRAQYGLLRPSCCSHYRVPARSRSFSPHREFFSIKARARPHGSYIENFPPWRRRNEILCSSGENNIWRLKAANEWYIVLSRNSLKIFRLYRVFFQLFSLSCCLEHAFTSSSLTCPYHNKSCSSHYSKQQTNQVHSARFERWESWCCYSIRPLVLHTKSRPLGSKMTS